MLKKLLSVVIATLLLVTGTLGISLAENEAEEQNEMSWEDLLTMLASLQDRQSHYWDYVETSQPLEAKYTALGSYEVSCGEYDAGSSIWQKYMFWYPQELPASNEAWPLVIMANGTGVKASQYSEVFHHLASWGFIVAGNEDDNSRTGESSAATLDYLLTMNSDPGSEFYGKIDVDHIGIAGHSQGGVGAINAVTTQENGSYYTAIWTASCTSPYHTENLGADWSYDTAMIRIPYMLVGGTGFMDAGNAETADQEGENIAQGICSLWSMQQNYDAIPAGVTKVMARRVGMDHGDMLRNADGYMTAWFMYWLRNDETAGEAFFEDHPEILENKNWQDAVIVK